MLHYKALLLFRSEWQGVRMSQRNVRFQQHSGLYRTDATFARNDFKTTMYILPTDIRRDIAANYYLTTKTVEFLLKEAIDGAKSVDGVFVFPPGIMPTIERDLREFRSFESSDLLRQRRDFYRLKDMHVLNDLLVPMLQDEHFFL